MTKITRGVPRLMLWAVAAVAALVLSACGTTTSGDKTTDTGSKPASAKYSAENPLKVVVLFQSATPNDGGWNESWERARKQIQEHFGDKIKTSFKVSVPDSEETVNIVDSVVSEGANVVIGVSYGQGEPLQKAAKKHPDVYFIQSQWKSPGLANWSGVDVAPEQGYYLAGMAAAAATKAKKIGAIVPFAVPFVLREINGFALGVQAVDPSVKVKGVLTNSWFDPSKDVQAARALMADRVDVMARFLDDKAIDNATKGKDILWVGTGTDTREAAPATFLATPTWEWGGVLTTLIDSILNDKWESTFLYADMAKDGVKMAWGDSFKTRVSADVQKKIEETEQAFKSGEKQVFTGPITGNDGKVAVPDGESLDLDGLLGMNFVVQGIDGIKVKN